MDRSARHDFYRALLKDYLQHPRTIIISSHHLEEVEHLLEQLMIIDEGKLLLHLPLNDVREYAIRVQGEKEALLKWLEGKEVWHGEEIAGNNYRAVVEKKRHMEEAEQLGFTISPISASELADYVTRKTKGVIDDVFLSTN